MSDDKHETIADIVREMRTLGRLDEKSTDKTPRSLQALGLRTYSDRIDAAAMREREAGAEAAQVCGEIGEMLGREAAGNDSLMACNAAAIRETLLRCDAIAQLPEIREYIIVKEMRNLINAALSAPPRNCDVGTVAEQEKRMNEFCNFHKHGGSVYACENCELFTVDRCELAWSQMPYDEGGAK